MWVYKKWIFAKFAQNRRRINVRKWCDIRLFNFCNQFYCHHMSGRPTNVIRAAFVMWQGGDTVWLNNTTVKGRGKEHKGPQRLLFLTIKSRQFCAGHACILKCSQSWSRACDIQKKLYNGLAVDRKCGRQPYIGPAEKSPEKWVKRAPKRGQKRQG